MGRTAMNRLLDIAMRKLNAPVLCCSGCHKWMDCKNFCTDVPMKCRGYVKGELRPMLILGDNRDAHAEIDPSIAAVIDAIGASHKQFAELLRTARVAARNGGTTNEQ